MSIETHKIPAIIFTVMKTIKEGGDLFKIDVYVHLLSHLTEQECHYLLYNKSNELFINDLDFLIITLHNALRLYEAEEEYETCENVWSSIQKYSHLLYTS